ncbi:MAG: hypothetical protein A2133_05115 [Actinobacteria bacterium RBG_16_64_13]|nr:MAG: hypothetical protein A2133_05115 [Actinobacteria bacterium RBG_16_64_13]
MSPKTRERMSERFLRCERLLSGWAGAYQKIADVRSHIDQAGMEAGSAAQALLCARGLANPKRKLTRQQHEFLAILPREPRRKAARRERRPLTGQS